MKFPLKEKTLEIRGQKVLVRELTAAQKAEWSTGSQGDKLRAQFFLASLCCVDPVLTEEEAANSPSEVIDAIAECALELSGINLQKKASVPPSSSSAE